MMMTDYRVAEKSILHIIECCLSGIRDGIVKLTKTNDMPFGKRILDCCFISSVANGNEKEDYFVMSDGLMYDLIIENIDSLRD